MKKSDCIKCRVSQQSFGELCANCYYTQRTNNSLKNTVDQEYLFLLIWVWLRRAFYFCIFTGAIIFVVFALFRSK